MTTPMVNVMYYYIIFIGFGIWSFQLKFHVMYSELDM